MNSTQQNILDLLAEQEDGIHGHPAICPCTRCIVTRVERRHPEDRRAEVRGPDRREEVNHA